MGCLYFRAKHGSFITVIDKIAQKDAAKHMRIPYISTWESKNGITYYDTGHHGFYLFVPEGCNYVVRM